MIQTKKSLFKASFEESLNLEDDGFRKLQQEQHDKTAKYFTRGRPTRWFRIRSVIAALIVPIGFNVLLLALAVILHESETLRIPIAKQSLLTVNVYLLLLLTWLLFVLLGKLFVKRSYLFPYRYQFHAFMSLNWFLVETDLLFTDFMLPALSWWGVLAIYSWLGIIGYWMCSNRLRFLRKLMYNSDDSPSWSDKLAKFVSTYGVGILGIGIIIKFILNLGNIEFSTSMKAIGLLLVWIVANVFVMAVVVFVGFPYFLQAYYKWTYPEEYREWESKSLEEWYGKKYLKKHKERLDNDTD